MRRILTATALLGFGLTLVIGVLHPQRAEAQRADGGQQDGTLEAGAGSRGETGSTGGTPATGSGTRTRTGTGSGARPCTYTPVPWELAVTMMLVDPQGLRTPTEVELGLGGRGETPTPGGEGPNVAPDGRRAFYRTCEGRPSEYVFLPPRRVGVPPAPLPTPGELAEQAAQQTPLPLPAVRMVPAPPVRPLVNLPMLLWIDPAQWAPQTASASAGGVTSMVTATPRRVLWNMGNGDAVSCDGPGVAFVAGVPYEQQLQGSDCQYTYGRSSANQPGEAYRVTTRLEFDVTWEAVGAPGGGDLGPAGRSTTTAVQVGEIQTLNIPVR